MQVPAESYNFQLATLRSIVKEYNAAAARTAAWKKMLATPEGQAYTAAGKQVTTLRVENRKAISELAAQLAKATA